MFRLLQQPLKFGVVGIAATLGHVGLFLFCVRILGMAPTPATVPAFLCALLVSYLLNHTWTFGARGDHRRFLPRYALIGATGACLNAGIMYLITEVLGRSHYLGLLVVVMVVPVFTFLASRFWGFRAEARS